MLPLAIEKGPGAEGAVFCICCFSQPLNLQKGTNGFESRTETLELSVSVTMPKYVL